MSWGLQQPALLTYITLMVRSHYQTVWGETTRREGPHSVLDFTIYCTVFSVIILALFQRLLNGSPALVATRMYPVGCHSFHLMNTCHVANNRVGTHIYSRNASHTQVSVSCVAEHRGNWALFLLYWSFLQVDSWLYEPQPLAIQLSLKDSSCAALDRIERPLCAPAHRGATVTTLETL